MKTTLSGFFCFPVDSILASLFSSSGLKDANVSTLTSFYEGKFNKEASTQGISQLSPAFTRTVPLLPIIGRAIRH